MASLDVQLERAEALDGVDAEEHAALPAQPPDGLEVGAEAGEELHPAKGEEARPRRQRPFDVGEGEGAAPVRDEVHRYPAPFEVHERVDVRGELARRHGHAVARASEHVQPVRGVRRELDPLRLGPEQPRHPLERSRARRRGSCRCGFGAVLEEGPHRKRRDGGVVEVVRFFNVREVLAERVGRHGGEGRVGWGRPLFTPFPPLLFQVGGYEGTSAGDERGRLAGRPSPSASSCPDVRFTSSTWPDVRLSLGRVKGLGSSSDYQPGAPWKAGTQRLEALGTRPRAPRDTFTSDAAPQLARLPR